MYYNEEVLFFFNNHDTLSNYLSSKINSIKHTINSQDENYILNVGQEQYIEYLVDSLKVDKIELIENHIKVVLEEEEVLLNHRRTKKERKPILYCKIPYYGDKKIFLMAPSAFTSTPPKAHLTDTEIIKKIVVYNEDFKKAEKDYHDFKSNLNFMISYVNAEIDSYNKSLKSSIENMFVNRKNELLRRRELLSELTIPIHKKENVSQTFSVPIAKMEKKIHVKPIVKTENFVPDPILDDKIYTNILTIINDMGKEFERKPSVYNNKGEEDLRDHFLMLLEPHFDGSATGETFNKSGKTDILLRYDSGNVFVGECKFWTGAKGFLKTIDQLLGYLTWRDSKTSVIMFVRNKDFTSVIETAKESIQTHENFIKYVDEKDESWFNYIFHLNGDKNKEIKVAVMLYHIPS